MIIKLVRHGESEQNVRSVNSTEIGDYNVKLTPKGHQQANAVGRIIGPNYLLNSIIYHSPFIRTCETLDDIIAGANVMVNDKFLLSRENLKIYEDVRLREISFGYNKQQSAVDQERELRKIHGWMLYRYDGGDSPCDCFDRICSFLESLHRQVKRKRVNRVLIITHGMALRCFVTRFLHLSLKNFEDMSGPNNCDIITITDKNNIDNPVFTSGKWGVDGFKLRQSED